MLAMPALRLLPEGKYVAYGSYSLNHDPTSRRPLESFLTLSHTEVLVMLEGSFSRPDGPKHGFKLELELPATEAGNGYFVFYYESSTEIKGVVGTRDVLDGRTVRAAANATGSKSQRDRRNSCVDARTTGVRGLPVDNLVDIHKELRSAAGKVFCAVAAEACVTSPNSTPHADARMTE
jgi:hypothetical protein